VYLDDESLLWSSGIRVRDARKVGRGAGSDDKNTTSLRAVILASFVEAHVVGKARIGALERAEY
jgi:hypothetical protein